MDIVVNGAKPRPPTAKDLKKLNVPKRFKPASGAILSIDEATRRSAKLGGYGMAGLIVFALLAFIGGFLYWANAPDDFEKSEFLPFPFLLGAIFLGFALLLRWLMGRSPDKIAEFAKGCPPPGPVATSEEGLRLGETLHPWASLRLDQLGVWISGDDGGTDYVVRRVNLTGEAGPFALDTALMRGGQGVVDGVWLRLKT